MKRQPVKMWAINAVNSFLRKFLNYLFSGGVFRDCSEAVRYYRQGGADVIFYCRLAIHYNYLVSTLHEVAQHKKCVLISSQDFKNISIPDSVSIYEISQFGLFLLRAKVAISPATKPPLGVFPKCIAPFRIHTPHSIVSFHMIYPPGSFKNYNVIFCAGPHHVEEAKKLLGQDRSLQIIDVGYGKLDLLKQRLTESDSSQHIPAKPVVLIAPSWGAGNLLEGIGIPLTEALLGRGYDIVLRPHPVFMGGEYLKKFKNRFSSDSRVYLEDSRVEDNAFYYADFMISDYSGVAFEFAYLRERPVIFADVPKKVNNPDWDKLGCQPIELFLRPELGMICAPEIESIVSGINSFRDNVERYSDKIVRARDKNLYNYGECGKHAAIEILRILDE